MLKLRIGMIVAVMLVAALTGIYFYSKTQARHESGRVVVPGVLHAGHTDFDHYRPFVQIAEGPGEVSTNFKGDRIAVVAGTLVNRGDRKLEAVELKVSLFDRQKRLLREEIKTPLHPGIFPHKPLDPLDSRPFNFWVEGIPAEWDPRRVDLEVYGIKFAK